MSIDGTQFPQLSKMHTVQDQSHSIGDFIEWLSENGMAICTLQEGLRGTNFYPVADSLETLLSKYFEIDLNAVERERRAVLASCATPT